MSQLMPLTHPCELLNDTLTEWHGDYYYRTPDGRLYMIKAISLYPPLEAIQLEYPTKTTTISS